MGICRLISADKRKQKIVLCSSIGRYLQHVRRECGLSGAEMGKKLGISQQQLSRYECGYSGMDVVMFLRYCWYLEVSPAECLNKVLADIADTKDSFW